jgi:hypothetical protein
VIGSATKEKDLKTIALGEWTLDSGNVCRAALERQFPDALVIRFDWTLTPTTDDVDGLNCDILPEVLQRATRDAELMANLTYVLHDMAADGVLEPTGVIRDGATEWKLTEKGKRQATLSSTPTGESTPLH